VQRVLQPPVTSVSQLPLQLVAQSTFASAVHEPSQDALHLASQSTDPSVPVHEASQRAVQLPEQLDSHAALSLAAAHFPEQSAEQVPLQLALQLNDGGSASQDALQEPEHEPVHDAVAVAVQEPLQRTSHVAETVTGVQLAVQPPSMRNAQLLMSEMMMSPPWA